MLIYAGALKGAGDTLYVMAAISLCSVAALITPLLLALGLWGGGLIIAFAILAAYISALALSFLLRYRGGKWKAMRVIEPGPAGAEPAAQG